MKIEKYITLVKNKPLGVISRGNIIDDLSDHNDNWILVLKALLIKNTTHFIAKSYLLEKLNFMKNNPGSAHLFLDNQGEALYNVLRGYYQ